MPATSSPAARTTAAAGRKAAVTPTATAPRAGGDERRRDHAEMQVLQRVDVADEAGEQVAVAPVVELGRREPLEPLVDMDARAGEPPQSHVVRGQALQVAQHRPAEPEEAHADDGDGEREDGRLLGRPRDQVAGGRHQADPEEDGQRAERDRCGHAAARHVGEREQPGDHARGQLPQGDDAVGVLDQLRAVRDEQDGAARSQALDGLGDDVGARPVEVGGRLVEDHERRVAQERPRQCDAPALAGGERAATVADDRLVAARQRPHEAVGACEHGRVPNLRRRRRPASPSLMLSRDGAAEEGRVLRYPGDLAAPEVGAALEQVDAADA